MPDIYPPYIFGLHDRGGEFLMLDKNRPGWALITEGIGADPYNMTGSDYSDLANKGLGVLVRLNYGYGSDGTLPPSGLYDDFARRCGNFVEHSPGCHAWIIGNEMNLEAERPGNINGSGGEPITPTRYATCYLKCRSEIRSRPGRAADQVIVGAVGPYNIQTKYPGNETGNFKKYLADILAQLADVDGISLHAYTHGSDPALVTSDTLMGAPVQTLHYHFRVYRDFMAAIPARLRDRPVYITETDQYAAWADTNSGWVRAAYKEINDWNSDPSHQAIQALILYRWIIGNPSDPPEVGWAIENKPGVQADMRDAMNNAYGVVLPSAEPLYRAAWTEVGVPTRMDAGADVSFPVSVRNDGRATWPRTGADAVQLGRRWISANGTPTDAGRTPLPQDVPPGVMVRLAAVTLQVPTAPGIYTLELDMIRGASDWFANYGSPVQRVTGIQVGPRYCATWVSTAAPGTGKTGQTVSVPVRVRNDGTLTWTPSGRNPFNLTYKWLEASRREIVADGLRTPLGQDVGPGQEIALNVQVQFPSQAGRYILQLDLVHEHVTWFHTAGSPPKESWVDVSAVRPDYAAQWLSYNGPQRLAPGQPATGDVQVRNAGAQSWPASGAQAVTLGYRWLDQQGNVLASNQGSARLSQAVSSDQTATFAGAAISGLAVPGEYRLIWDLVQAGRWLSAAGSPVLEVRVQVDAPPYSVAWEAPDPWPEVIAPGELRRARLRVRNTGSLAWPSGGAQPVHLACTWFTADGRLTEPWETFRVPLPGDVNPGAAADLDVSFTPPSVPGHYVLRWDLVREGITWFFRQGAVPLEVPLEVSDRAVFVSWSGTASDNAAAVPLAFDGDPTTAWDSQAVQTPGMWFQVDLGEIRTVSRFKATSPGRGFPVGYAVKVSQDQQDWRLVASVDKNWRDVDVAFAPWRARYIRLEQTGTPQYATSWTISDIAVGICVPWSSVAASHNPDAASLAVDGRLNTAWNTVAMQQPGMWFQLNLGTTRQIERVVLVHPANQQPRGYVVKVSADGQTWREVGRKDDNWAAVDVSLPSTAAINVRVETTNTSKYHPWGIAEFVIWESAPTWLRGRAE